MDEDGPGAYPGGLLCGTHGRPVPTRRLRLQYVPLERKM